MIISKVGKLNLLLKELSWISIDNKNCNKILQKTVCILIEMGLNFRYSFMWYINGPYCIELAEDISELQINKICYDEEVKNCQFKVRYRKIIDKYQNLFRWRKSDADWLKLISSILFIKSNEKVEGKNLENNLILYGIKLSKKNEEEAFQFVEKYFTNSSVF